MSKLEAKLKAAWDEWADPSLPVPIPQFRFHPSRKWSFDYAFPTLYIAVEVQGGTHPYRTKDGRWVRGRHSRGSGQHKDFEKLNEAQRLGWFVVQLDSSHLSSRPKRRKVVEYLTTILMEKVDAQYDTPAQAHLPTPCHQPIPNLQPQARQHIRPKPPRNR